ncbi:MAG TPA: dihydropteridine reductase [Candidatus Faecousia excrementipullorum]|nr:dihydropteridine reductase [Candidatus Faecousia excrementipullorum]
MNTDKIYAESIANQYAPKDTSKVVALRKLDRKAKQPSEIFAYTFGILSTLVLGTGMCLSMGVIGGSGIAAFAAGIILGVAGILGVSFNYPLYKKIRNAGMKKYAGDIMLLAKEITGNDQ